MRSAAQSGSNSESDERFIRTHSEKVHERRRDRHRKSWQEQRRLGTRRCQEPYRNRPRRRDFSARGRTPSRPAGGRFRSTNVRADAGSSNGVDQSAAGRKRQTILGCGRCRCSGHRHSGGPLRAQEAAQDGSGATATLRWQGGPRSGTSAEQLLLFEAFVSNKSAKPKTAHIDDARLAAEALHARLITNEIIEPDVTVETSFNILGAMMMRTGWSNDVSVLSQPCLVIKPTREHDPTTAR